MVKLIFLLVVFNIIALVFSHSPNQTRIVDSEKYLIDRLLKNYDKRLKPSDSVEIKFALNLNQIITLIEQEQIIVINVFLDHEWFDQRLRWNPVEYKNITLLRINSELLWS